MSKVLAITSDATFGRMHPYRDGWSESMHACTHPKTNVFVT